MKGFLKVAANFAIYLSGITLIAFSFLSSNEYIENLLAFYTWCAFVLAVCGLFSLDELIKVQRESKTPFWLERVYNFLEFIIILFSACTGHFMLAGSFLAMSAFCIWAKLEAKGSSFDEKCGINKPEELKPVLAKVQVCGDIGLSGWHEVVYWNKDSEQWEPYGRTFNGEKVVAWCKIPDDDSEVWNK